MESVPTTLVVRQINDLLHMQSYPTVVHLAKDVLSQRGVIRMLTTAVGRVMPDYRGRLQRSVPPNDYGVLTEN